MQVMYTPPPTHQLTVTSNKRADFTVKDDKGAVVGSGANATHYVVTLPEGDYTVSATRANTFRGPVPVTLIKDDSCNFTF